MVRGVLEANYTLKSRTIISLVFETLVTEVTPSDSYEKRIVPRVETSKRNSCENVHPKVFRGPFACQPRTLCRTEHRCQDNH